MKEADLGEVDIEEEAEKRKSHLYIPNWFSVEVKTGVSVHIDYCMSNNNSCICLKLVRFSYLHVYTYTPQ